jgi:hypothetical protein
MILVLMNAHLKPRAALLHPGRRFAAVSLDQASNIANASAFRDDPRLRENPGGQLGNWSHPLRNSVIFQSNTFVVPESADRQMIDSCRQHVLSIRGQGYMKCEWEGRSSQRGVDDITKGQTVTYTQSDGKKIQRVTEVVTGTESVVRAVSFLHR